MTSRVSKCQIFTFTNARICNNLKGQTMLNETPGEVTTLRTTMYGLTGAAVTMVALGGDDRLQEEL